MTKEYALRRGDGKRLMMTKSQIVDEIGRRKRRCRPRIDTGPEQRRHGKLAEILMMPGRMVSVEVGMEVPVAHDIGLSGSMVTRITAA